MITRRGVLRLALAGLGASLTGAAYAVGIEPFRRPLLTRYALATPRWPAGVRLRMAVLSDLHACSPWMTAGRIAEIVAQTNALGADIILLLGDYVRGVKRLSRRLAPQDWAVPLGALKAPLGTHAVLGNHDWWDDWRAQQRGRRPVYARTALEAAGIRVYENDVLRIVHGGHAFWLAGLADQIAILRPGLWPLGLDDLPGTLARISGEEPVILMAHEPDIFARVPARVTLTLAGHTHGGQVRLFGWAPLVPSRYGNRYAYGRVDERGTSLIVSGGLGLSILPVRFGMPPEIVLVELEGTGQAA